MLAIAIGSGANLFIIIFLALVALVTGISVTDILKTKEKEQEK